MIYLHGRLVVIIAFSGLLVVLLSVQHVQAGTFFPLNLFKFKPPGDDHQKTAAIAAHDGDAAAFEHFGYIEYKPNGTLILRSTMENGTNLQNLLLFKSVLNAIKVAKLLTRTNNNNSANSIQLTANSNVKNYTDGGVEHKFPPFLERILQRIQTYFSIYKYTDTSQPLPLQRPQPQSQSQSQQADILLNVNASENALDFDPDVGDVADVAGVVDGGAGGSLQSATNIVQLNTMATTVTVTARYTEFLALENDESINTKAAITTTKD